MAVLSKVYEVIVSDRELQLLMVRTYTKHFSEVGYPSVP